jgi:hypothetical protein
MLELIWLDEDNNLVFTEQDKETAAIDGDTRRCNVPGCQNYVGWRTEWSHDWKTGGDYPYAVWEDCALVGDDVLCWDHAEEALKDHFAKEKV